MTVFTIGYGGRMPDEFVKLLRAAKVKTLVDVRLRPDKSAMGAYSRSKDDAKGIAGLLAKGGIGYLPVPELGNPFMEYDDWPERYPRYLEAAGPLLFDQLADVEGPMCLMCAEKKVSECHRRFIAEYLAKSRGWRFKHIE
jgi:uncharacterized protein (DUF488 family)